MRRAGPRSGIVLVLALSSAACERRAYEVPDDGLTWHANPERRVPPLWPNLANREFVEVDLPEARNGRLDDEDVTDDGIPQFWVNFTADGLVQFKGSTYRFDPDEPDGAGPPPGSEIGHSGRQEMRLFLRELTTGPRWRDPDGASRIAFLVYADRAVRWQWIAQAIPLLTDREIRIGRFGLGYQRDGRGHGRMSGKLRPVASAPSEAPSIRLLVLDAEPSGGERPVRVVLGQTVVDLPSLDVLTSPERLATANAAWARVARALASAPPTDGVVRLFPADGVPWAYVVTTIDLAIDAGARAVELPEAGIRWELEPGTPPGPLRPARDHGVSAAGVALVLLGALILALATLRPLRRASRPRSGSGASDA